MTIYNSNLKMVMKKTNLFVMGLLAMSAVSLSSCSTEGTDVTNGTTQNAEGATSYLNVKVVTSGSTSTRADEYDPTDKDGKKYVDGTTTESEVKSVTFFLFDAEGNAYKLTNGKNSIKKTFTFSSNDHAETVESISNVQLVMTGETNTYPAKMIAVANMPENFITTSISMSELTSKVANLSSTTNGFVMSTSVYLDNKNSVVNCNEIKDYVSTDLTAANANPVTVYIERALARVNAIAGENLYTISQNDTITNKEVGEVDGKKVYAKINGWDVVSAASVSYLVKNIDANWTITSLFGSDSTEPWNSSDYHRSFWASMPTSGVSYDYPSWNKTASQNFSVSVYPQENTSADYKSKVRIAATLVDNNGNVVSFYKFRGEYLLGGDEKVKDSYLKVLQNAHYKKVTTEGDKTTYSDLAASDIELTNKVTGLAGYEATAQLASGVSVVVYNSPSDITTTDADSAANKLMAANPVQYFKSGKTYYFTNIKHLGDTGSIAEYGVVRNHAYQVTINSIAGFGTPVYNPGDSIVDEIPSGDKSTYLAAKVRVLSWRVVANDVNLTQTKN